MIPIFWHFGCWVLACVCFLGNKYFALLETTLRAVTIIQNWYSQQKAFIAFKPFKYDLIIWWKNHVCTVFIHPSLKVGTRPWVEKLFFKGISRTVTCKGLNLFCLSTKFNGETELLDALNETNFCSRKGLSV